jgi:hypothetical protein
LQHALGAARRGAGGQQLQAHDGADLAANQLHHIIEPPADDIVMAPSLP